MSGGAAARNKLLTELTRTEVIRLELLMELKLLSELESVGLESLMALALESWNWDC